MVILFSSDSGECLPMSHFISREVTANLSIMNHSVMNIYNFLALKKTSHHHHHDDHHHISVMELGHLLTRSGLTHPEVSSKVCHDSFCQLGNSVSLPWVIYYEAFCLHVVSSFSYISVICLKLVLPNCSNYRFRATRRQSTQ
jgi:hypothetical protein